MVFAEIKMVRAEIKIVHPQFKKDPDQ